MWCWLCGRDTASTRSVGVDADGHGEEFGIAWCADCGSGALCDAPAGEALARWYAEPYYGQGRRKFLAPVQRLFDLGKQGIAARVHRRAGGGTGLSALDIGCGTGQLLAAFEARGVRATGIERPGARARAVRPGLRILEGELQTQGLAPASFDIVTIWHVLEHFHDPATLLAGVKALLVEGGLLAVAVPNAASWQARCFGARWFHLDLPRHLQFIAHDALCRRLRAEGFDVVDAGTVQWSQCVFGFVQSTLNCLAPGRPNRFYELIRGTRSWRDRAELCAWSVLAGALLPLAVLEAVLAGGAGRGAVSIVLARKSARPAGPADTLS